LSFLPRARRCYVLCVYAPCAYIRGDAVDIVRLRGAPCSGLRWRARYWRGLPPRCVGRAATAWGEMIRGGGGGTLR
jgi:hypothetical protein